MLLTTKKKNKLQKMCNLFHPVEETTTNFPPTHLSAAELLYISVMDFVEF